MCGPRERWSLATALLALLSVVPAAGLEIEVVAVGAGLPAAGRVELKPAGGSVVSTLETRSVSFTSSGRAELDLPPGSLWRLRATARGFWSPEVVTQEEPGARALLRLFPSGRLRARLRVPRGSSPPSLLRIHLQPAPETRLARTGSSQAEGAVECPLPASGELDCELPAGTHDLRLRAQGYASEHRWGIEVTSGETRSLGELTLVPGASIAGSVVLAEPAAVTPRVTLRPLGGAGAGFEAAERLRSLAQVTQPDDRGFFQLEEVAPGAYVVEAQAPGFASARRFPVLVFEGRETLLGPPLALERPAALEVFVHPPVSPLGSLWRVELSATRETAEPSETLRSRVEPDGRWEATGLVPGRYALRLGTGTESSWISREVTVERGMPPIEIHLPAVSVRGRVTLGGEPVRARLVFGGVRGTPRVVLYSDRRGRFEGALPRDGRWSLAASFEAGGAEQELDPVEISARESETVWLAVTVPDTRLAGEVVDVRGEPLQGIRIEATRLDGSEETSRDLTDAEGRFRFRGLTAGTYTVRAVHRHLSGEAVTREVREGRQLARVRMVLQDSIEISGVVKAPATPVPGAIVYIQAETEAHRRAPVDRSTTGPDGRFTVRVPRSSRSLRVAVLAPGHAARILRLPVVPDALLELPVADFGGTLVLDLAGRETTRNVPFLEHQGSAFWLPMLRQWAAFHGQEPTTGGRWILPMMEIGDYALCSSETARCDRGVLPPDGELTLILPDDSTSSSSGTADAD